MRRSIAVGLGWFATVLLAATPAIGAPRPGASGTPVDPAEAVRESLPNPLAETRAGLHKEAVAAVVAGKATPRKRYGSEVVQHGSRYVEYRAAPTAKPLFTVLVEFGTQADPTAGGTAGPGHNQIPQPDRTRDNTTIWRSDFNRQHYRDLVLGSGAGSLRDFYLKQSGGRHKLTGDVSDWVRVPFNQARYGSSKLPPMLAYWPFVRDTAQAWYDAQVAAGRTAAQIKAYLSTFDRWDRYDYDGDGNFNEPDGYIDHFQAIHAGPGEETGGGAYGKDAIRSHRWYAFQSDVGSAGPAFNRLGGVPVGESGIWIGDYTVAPENGGLGVLAQQHARDLDVPDLADTKGANNGVGPWSLMAGGAWLSRGPQDIGSSPGYLGPWEKLFLGWLTYRTVRPKSGTTYAVLGAAGDGGGTRPQAVVVSLPDQSITTEWNSPFSGRYEWWGGSADDLDVTLTRPLDLRAARAAGLTAKAQYEIEEDYDFLYAEVSTNGGTTWTALPTAGVDSGETGLDGSTDGEWVDLSYDLSAYAGRVVQFRFRYQTDSGVHFSGPFLDDIALTADGTPLWTDTVEASRGAWVANRWTRFAGMETRTVPHFYLVENRSYTGYDEALRTGPYNFGWRSTYGDLVERFAAREGMLVWYVNYAFDDNNTSEHPGFGMVLPVDARPGPVEVPGYGKVGNARTSFDAAFGRLGAAETTFHLEGDATTVPASSGVPVFDDADPERYWTEANGENSVKVAGSRTRVEVLMEAHGYVDLMILKITN